MAHKLKIQVEDFGTDPKFIKVTNWSTYDMLLGVTNPVLKVNIPGRDGYSIITFPQEGSFIYSPKSLKMTKGIQELPDGLFRFVYSICPNEKVFTTFYHFRAVLLTNRLMAQIAKVVTACSDEELSKNGQLLTVCLLKLKSIEANSIDAYNHSKCYDLYNDIENTLNRIEECAIA